MALMGEGEGRERNPGLIWGVKEREKGGAAAQQQQQRQRSGAEGIG